MATVSLPYNRMISPLPGLILFGLALMILMATCAHALERHGSEAALVSDCLERGMTHSVWLKPDGRQLRICQLPDGRWGVSVETQDGRQITAFIKNKMTKWDQVRQYLINHKAELIWIR